MKIGFDFRMGGSINAGIGRYSFELLNHLLDKGGHTYVVFFNPENVDPADLEALENKGATLVPANYRHYSVAEQLFFPRLLKKHNLNLVHFPNFNVPIFYSGDFVVTIHDMVHHKLSGHKKSRYLKFLLYKFIINRAAQKAKQIITVTEAAKAEIIQYLNIDPAKITVTYQGPSRNMLESQDETAVFNRLRQRYSLARPYLLFVGTLERKKNIIKLCQGFDKFIKKYKFDMDLILVGKVDAHYPEIKRQALEITHKDNLVFTGYVDNDQQTALYQNAFAFITASMHEGFGLPGLEAMQYGLPVLASNTPVFNEVYDNAAIYFDGLNTDDIADKINLLVHDQPFYLSMQQKSLNRSQLFDWSKTAQETLAVYKKVKTINFDPENE